MSSRPWYVLLAAALTAMACRPGEGERCLCEGECRSGLVCAADGAVLRPGQCVDQVSDSLEAGACIDAQNVQAGDDGLDPPPVFDLGGWATDPAVTTSPATDDPMATTMDETTMGPATTESSSSGSSSSSSSSGSATDTDTDTDATGASSSSSTTTM